MKKIDISTPKYPDTFALVDDEDYKRLNIYKWHPVIKGSVLYVVRQDGKKNNRITHYMHREIIDIPDGKLIDHKNHDGLDNQRDNIRLCTQTENIRNARKRKNTSSIYKGVSYSKKRFKWESKIHIKNKTLHLGRYKKEIDAAIAYNKAALKLFGQFACINKV